MAGNFRTFTRDDVCFQFVVAEVFLLLSFFVKNSLASVRLPSIDLHDILMMIHDVPSFSEAGAFADTLVLERREVC